MVLSMAMASLLLLPTKTNAQNDTFFRCEEDAYSNRSEGGGYNLDNQTFGQDLAPLGSGIMVMLAAGGAYALIRRKR